MAEKYAGVGVSYRSSDPSWTFNSRRAPPRFITPCANYASEGLLDYPEHGRHGGSPAEPARRVAHPWSLSSGARDEATYLGKGMKSRGGGQPWAG